MRAKYLLIYATSWRFVKQEHHQGIPGVWVNRMVQPNFVEDDKSLPEGRERNWDNPLGCLAGAYWATIHKGTGLTTNLMMLGRENCIPEEVMFGQHTHMANAIYRDFVWKLKEQMQHP